MTDSAALPVPPYNGRSQVNAVIVLHLLSCRVCGMLRYNCTLHQSNGAPKCCPGCSHG